MPTGISKKGFGSKSATRDAIILAVVVVAVFISSYFFNFFSFIIDYINRHPSAVLFVDEALSVFFALSLGLAVFSLRRQRELKIETAERIRLQEELVRIATTQAQTERIVSKQLECEIELRKSLDGR